MEIEFSFDSSFSLNNFFLNNKYTFETILLSEAINVRDKIDEILQIGNIDLVNNAHKLVFYIIEGKDQELLAFAKQEGIAWATHSLTLSFKLEWVQAIRRTLWHFIKEYYHLSNKNDTEKIFHLEQQINNGVDKFLNEFFICYTKYKDSLISRQKKLVENLSVPIIPINSSICVLPLIGTFDTERTKIIYEKILSEIERLHIQTLIMDLSGIAQMKEEVIYEFMAIIDSILLMGCNTVITGLRKDIVREITKSGTTFNTKVSIYGTLQQALNQYF